MLEWRLTAAGDSPVEVLSSSSSVFSDNSRPAADSRVSEGFEILMESCFMSFFLWFLLHF